MVIKITDPELKELTGGIVQRASGELRSTEYDMGDTMREGYAYIAFGRDCKNILKTLAHEGLIDSVDQNIFFTNGQDK